MNEAVGVDVSKAVLDVIVHGNPRQTSYTNDTKGHKKLVRTLLALKPRQVVIESTGCYDLAVTDAMHDAGLPVVRINPRQARDFAKATGQLSKTDRLDACVLARMGQVLDLPRYEPKSAWQRRLSEWTQRRTQVVDMLSAERQLQAPFFLGGTDVWVAFPTAEMSHEKKMMSLRGNNPHFSKAVVFHELNRAEVAVLGAFQRGAGRLRATARFVDVESGEILVAVKVDRPENDVFELQDELAKQVKDGVRTVKERMRP